MMEEPSVWDYVKAKVQFWKKSNLDFSFQETAETSVVSEERKESPNLLTLSSIPWLSLLPFVVLLVGQFMLEPPDRLPLWGGLFYLVGGILLIFAVRFGYLVIPAVPDDSTRVENIQIRWNWLLAAGTGMVISFVLFGGNRFNSLNVLIWLFAIISLFIAILSPTTYSRWLAWITAAGKWIRAPKVNFSISIWGIALILALIVVGYFRLANLEQIPSEMVSDHAEKLYDVRDVLNGQYKIFFERNTGREAFQFYWTALIAVLFNTGISFMSLKIGTVIVGLITLYYMARLGNLLGGKWLALFVLVFAGIGYWPNIISRIGLRFPLYPFCVAPLMFYLIRGLINRDRNDFIWAGIALGIGLHGYTSSRMVPFLVVVAFIIYGLHLKTKAERIQTAYWLGFVIIVSFFIFLPLFRYALENPQIFAYRALTRVGYFERSLPAPVLAVFLNNLWNALTMFFWSNGNVWVHSIPYRPALDPVTAVLFFIGMVVVLIRYIQKRHWVDLLLLLSIPLLLMPSVLSLAFPDENPNLNRTAGAYVPVFLLVAIGFDSLIQGIRNVLSEKNAIKGVSIIGVIIFLMALLFNYELFFVQYNRLYRQSAWNTSEMGEIMRSFSRVTGSPDTVYVVGYPYWVDTRLVGINAGFVNRNPEIFKDQFFETISDPRAKLFMLNPADVESLEALRTLYPQGRASWYDSSVEGKDFILFMVPADQDQLP